MVKISLSELKWAQLKSDIGLLIQIMMLLLLYSCCIPERIMVGQLLLMQSSVFLSVIMILNCSKKEHSKTANMYICILYIYIHTPTHVSSIVQLFLQLYIYIYNIYTSFV